MPHALLIVLLVVVFTAAVFDARYRKIPNWLTVAGVLMGFGGNTITGGWRGLCGAMAGFALAFAVYFLIYALRGLGAGDVKLMAAIGSFTGPALWIDILLATAISGGACALILVASKRKVKQTLRNVLLILSAMLRGRRPSDENPALDVRSSDAVRLPHGVVIATGALICLFLGKLG
jgi:prepilin peptidase CpaA